MRSWKSSLSSTTLTRTINVTSWATSVFRMEPHNGIRNKRAWSVVIVGLFAEIIYHNTLSLDKISSTLMSSKCLLEKEMCGTYTVFKIFLYKVLNFFRSRRNLELSVDLLDNSVRVATIMRGPCRGYSISDTSSDESCIAPFFFRILFINFSLTLISSSYLGEKRAWETSEVAFLFIEMCCLQYSRRKKKKFNHTTTF